MFHSVITWSAHSIKDTKIVGFPNFAPKFARSASVTPRARAQAPQAKIGTCIVANLASDSPTGGHPTGVTASATIFRIRTTASPSNQIRTSCPASVRASPCENGKAALVGSSEPHALFIRILRVLCDAWLSAATPAITNGKAANWANRDKKILRAMRFSLTGETHSRCCRSLEATTLNVLRVGDNLASRYAIIFAPRAGPTPRSDLNTAGARIPEACGCSTPLAYFTVKASMLLLQH